MKHALFPVIAVLMGLLLTGCSGASQAPAVTAAATVPEGTAPVVQEAPSWQKNTEPVTLTMKADNLQFGEEELVWGEDAVSRLVQDLTGVKLVIAPNTTTESVDDQVREAAMEDPPILIFTRSPELMTRFSSADISQALDVLAAEYCPDFWESLDAYEILYNTRDDGHVYTLRTGVVTETVWDDPQLTLQVPRTLVFRRDLLAQLGREVPKSVEELEELLRLVKEKANELDLPLALKKYTEKLSMEELKLLGMSTETAILRQYAVAASPVAEWMGVRRTLSWDGSAIHTPLRDAHWPEYLQLTARWYRDGLLTLPRQEIPWRRNTDAIPWEYDKAEQSPYDYYGMYKDMEFATATEVAVSANEALYNLGNAGDSPYVMVESPLTWKGEVRMPNEGMEVVQAANSTIGTRDGGLFITKNARHSDRAILFLQFLRSEEGARLITWGQEGAHYTRAGRFPVYTESYRNPSYVLGEGPGSSMLRDAKVDFWKWVENPVVEGEFLAAPESFYPDTDVKTFHQQYVRAGQNYKQGLKPYQLPAELALPPEGSEEYRQYVRVQDAFYHGLWEIVTTAQDDVEVIQMWEALQERVTGLGLDALEASMTERFAPVAARYRKEG